MTPKEWRARAAIEYKRIAGIGSKMALDYAKVLFDAQDGDFCSHAAYSPEECAQEDFLCWDLE